MSGLSSQRDDLSLENELNRRQRVEHIAQMFYEAENTLWAWENVPEPIKDEFRRCARMAIAVVKERQEDLKLAGHRRTVRLLH